MTSVATPQVFSATNVELVTKTRTEHLSEVDKARHRAARSPLQSFLGTVQVEEAAGVPNGVCANRLYSPEYSPNFFP